MPSTHTKSWFTRRKQKPKKNVTTCIYMYEELVSSQYGFVPHQGNREYCPAGKSVSWDAPTIQQKWIKIVDENKLKFPNSDWIFQSFGKTVAPLETLELWLWKKLQRRSKISDNIFLLEISRATVKSHFFHNLGSQVSSLAAKPREFRDDVTRHSRNIHTSLFGTLLYEAQTS